MEKRPPPPAHPLYASLIIAALGALAGWFMTICVMMSFMDSGAAILVPPTSKWFLVPVGLLWVLAGWGLGKACTRWGVSPSRVAVSWALGNGLSFFALGPSGLLFAIPSIILGLPPALFVLIYRRPEL